MKHELTITHDKLIGARPFGVTCDCGFKAAAETYAEQKEKLRATGRLK